MEAEAPMQKAKTEEEDEIELGGIPISITDQKAKPGVIFILKRASLEVAKVGKVCYFFYCRCFEFAKICFAIFMYSKIKLDCS